MSTSTSTQKKRVIIIGGGWSGLYALKSYLDEAPELFDVTLYEKTNSVGGVWVYREDVPGGCFRNTCTTASKAYLHASDFPFPDDTPHFPRHDQVLKYLNDYADQFKLRPYIHTQVCIKKVRKQKDGRWRVVMYPALDEGQGIDESPEKKEVQFYDIVVVCSGQHQVPNSPKDKEPYTNFTGQMTHSHYYKHPTKSMRDQCVLVVGGGESASDVAAEVCEKAKRTVMSIRQGVWFHDRTVGAAQPADMVFTKHQRLLGGTDYQSWLIWIGRYLMLELMWGKGGTGIKAWQPSCTYFQGFLNKSRDVVDKVALGKVQPRSAVVKCEGKKVWFKGEEKPEVVDLIIFATGYDCNVPFLKPGQTSKKSYKLVFDPEDPTLCHIGTARPMIGSIPALGELQARWAAKVHAGHVALPSRDELKAIMAKDREFHVKTFTQDDGSLPQLVNHWAYSDEIASYFGAKPDLLRWFFRSPMKWWLIISAPWSAHIYRVEDPKTREQALKNIAKTWLPNHYPFRAFNYVMLAIDIFVVFFVVSVVFMLLRLIGIL